MIRQRKNWTKNLIEFNLGEFTRTALNAQAEIVKQKN